MSQVTPEGAQLRADLDDIRARLNEPEDSPRRLVIPDGKVLLLQIYGEYADGTIDAGLGVAKVWKSGLELQWNTGVTIQKGRTLKATTELSFSK